MLPASVGGCGCVDVTAPLCKGAGWLTVAADDECGRPLARGGDGGITLSPDDDAEALTGCCSARCCLARN